MHKGLMAISVLMVLLSGCANPKEDDSMISVRRTYLDSLVQQADACQKLEEEITKKENVKDHKSLVGQYDVFQNSLSDGTQTLEKDYSLIIENVPEQGHSDPNKYRVKNFMNEGKEWKLSGVLEKDLLVLSGNNATNSQRVNGSIHSLNGSGDSLRVKLVIRENTKKTDDLIQEVQEIWIRK